MEAVDFFCGAGGMTCGLRQANINVLAGLDIESEFRETYETNNGEGRFLNQDITKYTPEQLRNRLNLARNRNDLIFIGCSPCQYWSQVNTHKRNSSYTMNLLDDFTRFVEYFLPGYVVVENVQGLTSNKNNRVLLDFLDFLKVNRYAVRHEVIQANNFGVPQKRKRFILIAQRLDDSMVFPEEEYSTELTVRNTIGDTNLFPETPCGYVDTVADRLHTTSNLSEKNKQRIAITRHDGGTREAWATNDDLLIPVYKKLGPNNYKNIYSRMFWDQPAPTITTRFNSISNGRFGHPEQDRAISLREGASLQTFPYTYRFRGSRVSIAKQIGNAVPPELARRIGEAINEHYTLWQNLEQRQEQLNY